MEWSNGEPDETEAHEISGESQLRIVTKLEHQEEKIEKFCTSLEYKLDGDWETVASIPHDSSILTDEQNVFEDGMSVYYYRDGSREQMSRVIPPDEINNRPSSECVDISTIILEKDYKKAVRRYEEWHQIKAQ